MNREILFRAQTRRKGERVWMDGTPVESKWVYGGVCQYNEERAIIYQTKPETAKFPVYADTLGQYTGFTDKNGVKIFEGDILRFGSGDYVVEWCNEHSKYLQVDKQFSRELYVCIKESEVIGNIHDNPELLKGKTND